MCTQLGTQLLTSPTLSLERETLNAEKRSIVEEMCVLIGPKGCSLLDPLLPDPQSRVSPRAT